MQSSAQYRRAKRKPDSGTDGARRQVMNQAQVMAAHQNVAKSQRILFVLNLFTTVDKGEISIGTEKTQQIHATFTAGPPSFEPRCNVDIKPHVVTIRGSP